MIEIKGKYNTAKIFTDNAEEKAQQQIQELCDQEFAANSRIRIMPDTHAGAGCVIGTTMTIQDKITPNLVGVDIGCGMLVAKFSSRDIDMKHLDGIVQDNIPSGFDIHEKPSEALDVISLLDMLRCKEHVNIERALKSVGTLGGGNHFIELNKDDEGNMYLVAHTGSRNLGKQIADHYQKMAIKECNNQSNHDLISELKKQGREKEVQTEIQKRKQKIPDHLAYLKGQNFSDYIHDMRIAQDYASINRNAILKKILCKLNILSCLDYFETIHNYIEVDTMILRKGAISAKEGEPAIIPINMRDGSLIVIGKGNPDWNYSAPHGAGRLMSRKKAKEFIQLKEFQNSMKDVYSTSITEDTIDESPFAYKSMDEIINNIHDTADIVKIIKPVYNFKASK